VLSECECEQRGRRTNVRWLGGSGFSEHLSHNAHTFAMFPMPAHPTDGIGACQLSGAGRYVRFLEDTEYPFRTLLRHWGGPCGLVR
jgi:hypothetical protein